MSKDDYQVNVTRMNAALESRDPKGYYVACNKTGLDIIDPDLYNLGKFELEEALKQKKRGKEEGALAIVAKRIHDNMIEKGMPLASFPDWIRNYLKDEGITCVFFNGKVRPTAVMNRHDLAFYASDLMSRFPSQEETKL